MIICHELDIVEAKYLLEKIQNNTKDEEVFLRTLRLLQKIANSAVNYDSATSAITQNKYTNVFSKSDSLFMAELETRNTDLVETMLSFFKLTSTISRQSIRFSSSINTDDESNNSNEDEEEDDDDDFDDV